MYVLIDIYCIASDYSVNYLHLSHSVLNRYHFCNPECKKNDTISQLELLCSFYGNTGSRIPNGVIFKTNVFRQLKFYSNLTWFLSCGFFITLSESMSQLLHSSQARHQTWSGTPVVKVISFLSTLTEIVPLPISFFYEPPNFSAVEFVRPHLKCPFWHP